MEQIERWRKRLVRKASRLVLDPLGASSNSATSWFGRMTFSEAGESWPAYNGRLMWPLLQVVVRDLPFRPTALNDIAIIRVFVNPGHLAETDNGGSSFYMPEGVPGEGWLLRASPALENLVPVVEPDHGSTIHALPGHWELIEDDYPTFDHLPPDSPDSLVDDYCASEFVSHQGTKIGGWPFTVQNEVSLARPGDACDPEYVFQIDSDYKHRWMWGDLGLAYFGRGAGAHRDKWAMDWQCM